MKYALLILASVAMLAQNVTPPSGGGGGGSGTVTSVAGSGPSWLTWTITNPTAAASISLAPTTGQSSHQVVGTCNAATTFAPCALVIGDLPSTVVTGPGSSVSGHVATFNGTGGTVIQDGGALPTVTGGTCTAPQVVTAISGTAVPTCTAPIMTQNSQSAAYTTVLGDAGKMLYHPGADTTARTWTIDSNANVAYIVGTCISFFNDTSAGVVTIAITSDTLVQAGSGATGSRTLAASNIATACKVATTRWMISGSLGLT